MHLIVKLIIGIRAYVYMELMSRSQARRGRIGINKELNDLGKFVQDLVQTPFGFLREVMHLTVYISGDGSSLPQISWPGKEKYRLLAIHSKKVELTELDNLSNTLLKKTFASNFSMLDQMNDVVDSPSTFETAVTSIAHLLPTSHGSSTVYVTDSRHILTGLGNLFHTIVSNQELFPSAVSTTEQCTTSPQLDDGIPSCSLD